MWVYTTWNILFLNQTNRTKYNNSKKEIRTNIHLFVRILYKIRNPHWRQRTGSDALIIFFAPQSPQRYSTPPRRASTSGVSSTRGVAVFASGICLLFFLKLGFVSESLCVSFYVFCWLLLLLPFMPFKQAVVFFFRWLSSRHRTPRRL